MQTFGYAGFALIAALGWLVLKEYISYVDERALWYKETLSFLLRAEREVGCFLRTVEEVCAGHRGGFLDSRGALGDIARARELRREAFLGSSLIDKDDKNMLYDFFCGFGMGYHDAEMRSLAAARSRFEESCKRIGAECSKNRRLAPIIYAFSFASVLLLLL